MEGRFDNFLITIIQESGGIEGILNTLFSFLLRRTDFFYEMNPGDKMGFPPGEAVEMVNQIMNLYKKEYHKKVP